MLKIEYNLKWIYVKKKIQSLFVAAFPQSHLYLTSDLHCNIKKSNAESRNLASGNKQTIF